MSHWGSVPPIFGILKNSRGSKRALLQDIEVVNQHASDKSTLDAANRRATGCAHELARP